MATQMTRIESGTCREIELRLMQPTDMADVLTVERESFIDPFTAIDIKDAATYDFTLTLVIAVDDLVIGHLMYRVTPGLREIMRIAVLPSHRRRGFGSLMIDTLKLAFDRVPRCKAITSIVRESDLPMLTFMRSNGIPAVGLLFDYFEEPVEDGVLFKLMK